jgi:hypothetical protein
MYSKILFAVAAMLAIACYAHAGERYNEDACYKDYIQVEDKDVVLAVNRDTNEVELYWSEKDETWLKPDETYKKELQKIYNKKLRMLEAQRRMDEAHNETWYNTSQGRYGRH